MFAGHCVSMAEEVTGEGVKLLDPQDDIKPRVSKDIVPNLVERLYGLKVELFRMSACIFVTGHHVLASLVGKNLIR